MNKQFFYNIGQAPQEEVNFDSHKLGSNKEELLTWGSDNKFPSHVRELFLTVPILRSLIEGSSLLSASLFSSELSLDFDKMFRYLYTYGCCPLFVRQSRDHKSFYLTPLDPRFVRTNKERTAFAYCETAGWRKYSLYPPYSLTNESQSILYLDLNSLASPYPLPIWSSALRETKILSQVSQYHDSSLKNGFNPSALISFTNGIPSSEDKRDIERLVEDKFCDASNANRIMVSFSDDAEHAPVITPINVEDRSNRYLDLVRSCKEALCTSFRASSQLFGAPDGSETALTANEYSYKLALFVRFTLEPIVNRVHKEIAKFGVSMKDPMSLVTSTVSSAENE